MSTTAHKVATQAASATGARMKGRRPPSVVREIVYGMSLGLLAGYLWKLHHWSNQRRTREFYSLLDEGRITVVVDEPAGAKE
ncbi:putative cytochrome c oxidase subunit 5C-4 [Hordeum vulgare]|uniref:putative cytochrome c oxidase subunit 5C-4 n=1 Tax=Hordeum vulgare subsp. vulgare TaxID=112509 RepID=UPI000B4650DE|nr:putative cytochrome c oxidase subunit 5C-4 [Hordeum vulgare subsp. vulgare]KAE8800113.1 putative cytochrome c oxidase subunit 5C-4 [Hordeum vulgare]